jgi:hypothetical protein
MDARKPKKRQTRKNRMTGSTEILQSLRELRKVGNSPQSWFEPSADSVARLKSIPLIDEVTQKSHPRNGRVVFDSWDMAPAIALRDIADGHVRHLELKAGSVSLEIVAERAQDHWEFVGRIYRCGEIQHSFIMKVGRFSLMPQTDGFYHWSSSSVPRVIRVVSYNNNLHFGGIKW